MKPESIARFMRSARKITGLSVRELAERAEVSHQTVWRLERTGHCSLSNYMKIREAIRRTRPSLIGLP